MNRPCLCRCIFDDARFEAKMRKLFQEFVSALHQSPSLTPNLRGGISEAKQLQLAFSNELKQEYYTQHKMLAEHNAPVQIVLLDVGSQSIVTEGPISSLEVEICVLPGDFGSGDHQNWSSEQFNANIIVQPREGRPRALLKGDTRITLKHGVAIVGKIEFTDISRWDRTGTFRLAAKSKAANVREAISQPFTVKDKRGVSTMKHAQPSLNSEIWRLRHIAKGKKIHKQLSDDGIKTVKDFLRLHTTNPPSLKEKFGNISTNRWEAILENARACVIDDNEHFVYQATKRGLCLVFNSIYEVVKVSLDRGQTYRSPETFTSAEKQSVEAAKEEAYQNVDCFKLEDLEELLAAPQIGMSPDGGAPEQVDLLVAQQGEGFDGTLPDDSELLHSFLSPYLNQESGGAPQQVDLPTAQQGQGFDEALPDDSELLHSCLSPYPNKGSGGASLQVDFLTAQQGQGFDGALPSASELLHSSPSPYPNQGSGGAPQQVDFPTAQQGFDGALPNDGELLPSCLSPYPDQGFGGAPQQVDLPASQQGQGFDGALPDDSELLHSCLSPHPNQGFGGAMQQVDLPTTQQGQDFEGDLPGDSELLHSCLSRYLYHGSPFRWLY